MKPGLKILQIATILSLLVCACALAHEAGVTDTQIVIARDSVTIRYTVPRDHLAELDITGDLREAPGNSNTSANRVKPETGLINTDAAVTDVIANGFTVINTGTLCHITTSTSRSLDSIGSEQFDLHYDCGDPIRQLSLEYQLLFDRDPSHRNLTRISLLRNTQHVTFDTNKRTHVIDVEAFVRQLAAQRNQATSAASATSLLTIAKSYFPIGFEHIVFGFDHLLFLAVLLLLPMGVRAMLILITTFTIAHSLTLALAVLNVVTLPPALVESVIAFSIVYMSIETIWLLRQGIASTFTTITESSLARRAAVTAIFGLLHGFGFSFLLQQLDLGEQLLSSLLFFNLGVEAGQILIMAIVFPLILYLFKRYPRATWAQYAALFIGAIGLFWLVERVHSAIFQTG